MLDLTDIEQRLRAMEAFYRQRAVRGLVGGAADMQQAMRQTTAYNDDTEATRAGTVAYVVTPDNDGSAALGDAVADVEAKNPGHSATARGRLRGEIGVIATVPTDYQEYLERLRAGQNAVIAPTFGVYVDELTARIAEGQ